MTHKLSDLTREKKKEGRFICPREVMITCQLPTEQFNTALDLPIDDELFDKVARERGYIKSHLCKEGK